MRRVTADEAVQARPLRRHDPDRRLGRRPRRSGSADGGGRAALPGRGRAAQHHVDASGRPRRRQARSAPGISRTKACSSAIICGTFVNSPKISDLAIADKIEGYTLPQGALSQLMREMAAGRAGPAHARPVCTPSSIRATAAAARASAPRRIWSSSCSSAARSYLFYQAVSRSTSASCAAPPPTRTATSRWRRRRSSARCCRWRRRRGAAAASSSCRSSAWRSAARCRRSR